MAEPLPPMPSPFASPRGSPPLSAPWGPERKWSNFGDFWIKVVVEHPHDGSWAWFVSPGDARAFGADSIAAISRAQRRA